MTKTWSPRKTREFSIGRMFTSGIRDIERYCLRMLLHNVRGASSFECLRTVEGVERATFKGAATAMGLLADDAEWDNGWRRRRWCRWWLACGRCLPSSWSSRW